MMNLFPPLVVSILHVALLGILSVPARCCVFPTYMTSLALWDTRVRDQGLSLNVLYIFSGPTINIKEYGDYSVIERQRNCVRSVGNDKYIVSDTENNDTFYMCVQFIKRSAYVVQTKLSDNGTSDDESLCDDSGMFFNDWPLVYTGTITEHIPCVLEGGFTIRSVYDSSTATQACVDSVLTPRVESDCVAGEGVLFDLKLAECAGSLHLSIQQETYCLAGWHQDGHIFLVISDKDNFWSRNIWMMRLPASRGSDFQAYIFKDLVVDRGMDVRLTEYVLFNMTQINFPSLCEDEALYCNDPELDCDLAVDNVLCQSTCQICNYLRPPTECEFEGAFRGEWVESSVSYRRMVHLTRSMLYADDLPAFTCFNPSNSDLAGTGRRPLHTLFRNGCKPRYSCIEYTRVSDTMLRYRMSQSLIWPHRNTIQNGDICALSQFVDDPLPLGSKYRSHEEKTIVISSRSVGLRNTTSCEWPTAINFTVHHTGSSGVCLGFMHACEDTNSLVISYNETCFDRPMVQTYRCLGSYQDFTTRFVFTELQDDPSDLQCWVLREDIYDNNLNNLYLLRPADCHRGTLMDVEYRNEPVLANFVFHPLSSDLNYRCPSDSVDEVSTAASPSTTGHIAGSSESVVQQHTTSPGNSGTSDNPSTFNNTPDDLSGSTSDYVTTARSTDVESSTRNSGSTEESRTVEGIDLSGGIDDPYIPESVSTTRSYIETTSFSAHEVSNAGSDTPITTLSDTTTYPDAGTTAVGSMNSEIDSSTIVNPDSSYSTSPERTTFSSTGLLAISSEGAGITDSHSDRITTTTSSDLDRTTNGISMSEHERTTQVPGQSSSDTATVTHPVFEGMQSTIITPDTGRTKTAPTTAAADANSQTLESISIEGVDVQTVETPEVGANVEQPHNSASTIYFNYQTYISYFVVSLLLNLIS